MIILSKKITLVGEKPFNAIINGNDDSQTVIILVHGFGVRSDSRGLFTSIEREMRGNLLIVRGEFAEIETECIKAIPISSQVKRLQAIVDYVKKELPSKKLIFIGHSQGCIVIAQAKPVDSIIFLLAPPLGHPYYGFVTSAGWKNPGSHLDINGESRLIRSDKTLIFVYPDFWNDFKHINADDLYRTLNNQNHVYLVLAVNDHVYEKQEIPQDMNGMLIKHANHDFEGESRRSLVKKLEDCIVSRGG